MTAHTFGLRFGAMAPKLANQIPASVVIDAGELERWQRDADAITRLVVRGIISAAIATQARRKLMSEITKAAS